MDLNLLNAIVSEMFSIESIKAKSRVRRIVDAKKVFSKICYDNSDSTVQEIGNYLGLDHSTITFHLKASRDLIKVDKQFKERYQKCLKAFKKLEKEVSREEILTKYYINKIIELGVVTKE